MKNVREILCDLLLLIGIAGMAYGFWRAWPPLGFIVGGFFLAAFAFFAGYRRPRRTESEE